MTITLNPTVADAATQAGPVRRGSTPRTQLLRQESETTRPSITLERAVIETEVYRAHEGKVPPPVLRGLFFRELMARRTLHLGDGELIVGEKGTRPQQAPTFPELCCHTLADFDNMDQRERVSFAVSDEDRRLQAEIIIPFWSERATMTKMMAALPDDWHRLFEAGLFTEFMAQRGPGHTVADGKIYRFGYLDFMAQIDERLARVDYGRDMDAAGQAAELRGMRLVCEGMVILGERYAALARRQAAQATDPARRHELEELAAVCDRVPAHAPTTFREALQMYWFSHIGVTSEMNNWDAYSPGKLDQHLEPFYLAETAAGRLTRQEAQELLECLWIKFNNQPAPPKVGITLKESATYTDFCNINTGSLRPDGTCGVSEVSYLILETMDELRLLQPSSNVQISRKSPEHFLRRAVEISREGWGQPAFYNSEAVVAELLNMGKSLDDARSSGIASGCVETGTAGKEAYVLTGYLNVPKVLELVLWRGFDHYTGRQVAPDLGEPREFRSYDELYAAFTTMLRYVVDVKVAGNNLIEALFMETMPVPLLSVLTDDCVETATDYNAGGARYNTSYIQCVGIATVTDSLAVCRHHVFGDEASRARRADQAPAEAGPTPSPAPSLGLPGQLPGEGEGVDPGPTRLTMDELIAACEADFVGHEATFETVFNQTPKYGNDDDAADDILQAVADTLRDVIAGRPTPKGSKTIVEFLPTTCHVYFGQVMEASPNGRRKGIPLPDGISPEKGADRRGPTAVLKSAAKLDQLKTGGALLNQKFTPGVVAGERGLAAIAALIRTYFAMDGHHLQFNVVDRATLIDAQQHPEQYANLIVRVAGYSDYFNNLDKALQDEIINRTEQVI